MSIEINLAKDFTMTPGGRFIKEGPFSGEEFREKVLYPAFIKSTTENTQLIVNLDGGYGYGSSFLDESFGGLARKTHDNRIQNIIIISQEEPELIEKIRKYIDDGLKEA